MSVWVEDAGELCAPLSPRIGLTLERFGGVTSIRDDEAAMQSCELANLAGVSTDTLRHYERLGLLPRPHRTGNTLRSH
jgi:hypothetical protein